MAMLATRLTRAHRFGAIGLCALLAASLLFAFLAPPVRGDLPTQTENGDASRTVTWTMGTSVGLALQGVDLESGNATLPWKAQNLSWDRPGQFAANGSFDSSLAVDPAGISLRADATNHVVDGDFVSGTPWTFQTSASGNVTAAWNTSAANAVFRHNSPKTEAPWDSLDANPGIWAGVNGIPWTNTTGPHEGTGMLGLNFTLGPGPGAWAGVQHQAVVNWSGSNRMVIWVLPTKPSLPLTFNITATVGTSLRGSKSQALVPGWQEIVVDLTELGASRGNLISLTLRVMGQNIPSGTVYFDNLRTGNAKQFDETARVRQTVIKTNATAPALGSAVLRVNWSTPSATGVVRVDGVVDVTGPSGSAVKTFAMSSGMTWRTSFLDFSATTALPGLYDVSVGIRVVTDNTSTSSVEVRADDVSLLFPNRHNGTYLSSAVAMGAASEFLRVTWAFDAFGPATLRAALRTGNDSGPGSPTWSPWQVWATTGSQPAGLPPASFFQVRVDLMTVNASVSPVLHGMTLDTRHRSAGGSVTSAPFNIPAAETGTLLHWRKLQVRSRTPVGTALTFEIGDGTYWRPVAADGNMSDTNSTTISWRATLATADGLVTPTLERVDLVYEYLGPIVRVELRWPGWPARIVLPSGGFVKFTALALDAGFHLVSREPNRFDWNTNDTRGRIGIDGTYKAGEPGDHIVNVTFLGTSRSAVVSVHVLASATWIDVLIGYAPYWLAVLTLGAVGYSGYRFGIRRTSVIDDVFLISKDGRLLMHNTRRMRADRDEDILSGMLTAILAFLKDSDPEENGELTRFEIGGKTTMLERGPHAYLVAVYSGRVPRWAGKNLKRFMTSLEANFGDVFAKWSGDPEDLQGLKAFTGRFVSRFRFRPPRRLNGRAA